VQLIEQRIHVFSAIPALLAAADRRRFARRRRQESNSPFGLTVTDFELVVHADHRDKITAAVAFAFGNRADPGLEVAIILPRIVSNDFRTRGQYQRLRADHAAGSEKISSVPAEMVPPWKSPAVDVGRRFYREIFAAP
jgi:hypothetical protein